MNKLLPEKKDLVPITNPATTFYDCGFNVEFDKLDFKKKLEVVNDRRDIEDGKGYKFIVTSVGDLSSI